MYCENCGVKLEEDARFCGSCGTPVKREKPPVREEDKVKKEAVPSQDAPKKKKDNKKMIMILAAVIVLAIIAGIFMAIGGSKSEKEYDDHMATAEKYLEELDYEQAEAEFLSAIDIAPKKRKPYVELAKIYVSTEEYDKAEEILIQADEAGAKDNDETLKKDEEVVLEIIEMVESEEILDVPLYEWDFTQGFSEKNGSTSRVNGDVEIYDVGNEDIGSAAFFDGDGDYLICGNDVNLTEDFTYNTYLCCMDVSREYSAFFAKYEINHEGAYAFSIKDGRINCWFTNAEHSGYREVESKTALENGKWYYISIVKEGLNIRLYIDGKLEVEETLDSVVTDSYDLVTIGRQALMFSPEDQLQFKGYIAKISIYDKALTEEQINWWYRLKIKGETIESKLAFSENQGQIPDDALEWNGHHYAVFNNCSTWDEASAYCKSIGGHLAVITSQEENDAIYSYMLSIDHGSGFFGLTDAASEGDWAWENGEAAGYTNWHPGEPNSEHDQEDYAMFYYTFEDGTWNDGGFADGAPFICEWDR